MGKPNSGNMTAMHRFFAWTILLAGLTSSAFAQPATPAQMAGVKDYGKPMGTLHLQSNLGSFRLIDGLGRLEMRFTGTVLVSGLTDGKVTPGGSVKLEHKSGTRELYHGTGTIVVTGKWRAIQWFGTGMRAVWYGHGLARITGEFDRNLDIGRYWYNDPTQKFYWFAQSSITVTNPQQVQGRSGVKPTRRRR
jgi:hypothetical protein